MAGIFDLPDFYFFYFTKGTVNPAFLSIFFYIPEFPHSHIVLLFCFQFRHRKRIFFCFPDFSARFLSCFYYIRKDFLNHKIPKLSSDNLGIPALFYMIYISLSQIQNTPCAHSCHTDDCQNPSGCMICFRF